MTIHIAIKRPCRFALSGQKMQKNELNCHKVDFLKSEKKVKTHTIMHKCTHNFLEI
jgi:hypothetical protein